MKKLLLVLSLLLSIEGFSCKCANSGLKLNEYAASSDIAFKGKILSEVTKNGFHYYDVKIEKRYEGKLIEERIQLRSLATTSCQFRLIVEEEYFIFASIESPDLYSTDTCSGTQLYDEKKEVELLNDRGQ